MRHFVIFLYFKGIKCEHVGIYDKKNAGTQPALTIGTDSFGSVEQPLLFILT